MALCLAEPRRPLRRCRHVRVWGRHWGRLCFGLSSSLWLSSAGMFQLRCGWCPTGSFWLQRVSLLGSKESMARRKDKEFMMEVDIHGLQARSRKLKWVIPVVQFQSHSSTLIDDPDIPELPDDVWTLILSSIDKSHWRYVALACRSFHKFFCGKLHSLTLLPFNGFSLHDFGGKLLRFPNLKAIKLNFPYEDLSEFVLAMAGSDSKLLEWVSFENQTSFPSRSSLKELTTEHHIKCFTYNNGSSLGDLQLSWIVENLKYLQYLDISYPASRGSHVTDHGMDLIASELEDLTSLNISGQTFLTSKSAKSIQKMLFLEELEAHDTIQVASAILSVPSTTKFLHLGLSGFQINQPIMANLQLSETTLETLLLCNILIDIPIFLFLGHFRRLTSIRLVLLSFPDITSDDFQRLFPSIKSFYYRKISSFPHLFKRNLELAELLELPKIEEVGFQKTCLGNYLLGGISKIIKRIDLSMSTDLSSAFLVQLAKLCPSMASLTLAYCEGSFSAGLNNVIRNCLALRTLKLHGCAMIECDKVFEGIETCGLEALSTPSGGDEWLQEIKSKCGAIRYLFVSDFVTWEATRDFLLLNATVKTLHLNERFAEAVTLEQLQCLASSGGPFLERIIIPKAQFSSIPELKILRNTKCLILSDEEDYTLGKF